MSRLVLVEGPTALPITIEEVKSHIRVTHYDEDDVLTLYIGAAVKWAENFTGRALAGQTWDFYIDAFPESGKFIEIPRPPLISILDFVSPVGGESFSAYALDESHEPARLYLPDGGSWPTLPTTIPANVARIRYRAGYFDTDDSPTFEGSYSSAIPEDIKCAILMYVGTLYQNREALGVGAEMFKPPWGAEQLLRMHRVEFSLA